VKKILISFLKTVLSKSLKLPRWDLHWVLLLGTLVRLLLMPFSAHPFDVYSWYKYCTGIIEHGIDLNVILASIRPFWFLTLIPIAFSYGFLSSITGIRAISVENIPHQWNPQYTTKFIPDPLFNILVKTPMLITDVVTTLVLYKLVGQLFGREKARIASLLFFLNPISIWISAAWGQYESIPTLFTVLSLYLLLNKKVVSSALSLFIATLYKVYPIIFLIPTSIYLYKKCEKRNVMKYYIAFFTPFFIFLLIGGIELIQNFMGIGHFFSTSNVPEVFGYGLTYWSISMLSPLDFSVWAPLSILLIVFLMSISVYFVLKVNFDTPSRDLTISTFILFAAGMLSFTKVGEPRFLWLLPFLTLMLIEGIISKKVYVFLSLTSFIYTQKNFPYYLLPIATINQDILKPLFEFANPFGKVVEGALLPTPLSAAVLAILGTLFAIVMLITYMKIIRKEVIKKNLT